jgi:hypothetical protein
MSAVPEIPYGCGARKWSTGLDSTAIFRLVYVSDVASPTWDDLPAVMEDILLASVANNRRDDITGLLICNGVHFAQALEGPQDKVEACFARISADSRNVEPVVRELGWSDGRAFPRWSMCAVTLSRRDDALLTVPDLGTDVLMLSAGALWQRLTGIAALHGPELDLEHERLLAMVA